MKLVCISDTHMLHHNLNLPFGDVLIHAGDATNNGTQAEIERVNEWFGRESHKFEKIIFVPGNHDWLFETDPIAARKIMTNATVLIDERLEFKGKTFYGSPHSKMFYSWAFMADEAGLAERYKHMPRGLDVLITHGPAFLMLDANFSNANCGSIALSNAIHATHPKVHICGHIHESYGTQKMPNTLHANAASAPGPYLHGVLNPPIELEI